MFDLSLTQKLNLFSYIAYPLISILFLWLITVIFKFKNKSIIYAFSSILIIGVVDFLINKLIIIPFFPKEAFTGSMMLWVGVSLAIMATTLNFIYKEDPLRTVTTTFLLLIFKLTVPMFIGLYILSTTPISK